MRWQSSVISVARRIDFTTGGPIVRLGTKCPSMTSRWSQSAPAAFMRAHSSARRAKSPERSEGAMRTPGFVGFMLGVREGREAGELDALDELERGAAARRDEAHALREPELPRGGGAVASSDDGPRG